jgi:hypothetical protein
LDPFNLYARIWLQDVYAVKLLKKPLKLTHTPQKIIQKIKARAKNLSSQPSEVIWLE